MVRDMVKALVLRVEGTNCDLEMAHALELGGAEPRLVHMNRLLSGDVRLESFQLLAIPGGFAHGDDISAGKIFATLLKYRLERDMKNFVESGKPVIGVCNGFQVLVKAGILPGFDWGTRWGTQEATLAANDCGTFVDRWVHLKTGKSKCPFSKGLKKTIFLPIAHGEGKFMAGNGLLDKLVENDQVVFSYVENPNGSLRDIAGICNPAGNVLGMMPHPERYLTKYTHPYWTASPELPEEGDGLQLFRNAVEYARKF